MLDLVIARRLLTAQTDSQFWWPFPCPIRSVTMKQSIPLDVVLSSEVFALNNLSSNLCTQLCPIVQYACTQRSWREPELHCPILGRSGILHIVIVAENCCTGTGAQDMTIQLPLTFICLELQRDLYASRLLVTGSERTGLYLGCK
jgi:hypothetical protein